MIIKLSEFTFLIITGEMLDSKEATGKWLVQYQSQFSQTIIFTYSLLCDILLVLLSGYDWYIKNRDISLPLSAHCPNISDHFNWQKG